MEPITLAIVMAIYFIAAFIKGITGLGFSTSALGLMVLIFGLKESLPLLLIPSLASNAMVMAKAGSMLQMLDRFRWVYLWTVIGVGIGLYALNQVSSTTAGAILGAILILYCLWAWTRPNANLTRLWEARLAAPTGLLTGLVNGFTGSQVMPLLPYLLSIKLQPNQLVQASNISFTLSSLVMFVGLTKIGLMTLATALISAVGIIPVYLGLSLGAFIRDKLHPRIFRLAVLVILIMSGLMLIAKPFIS